MSGSDGNGDNYVGMSDDQFQIDPTTASWMAAHQGTPTWDGSGTWDTGQSGQSWWDRLNTPENAARLNALKGGLALKPLADPNAANVARQFPGVPAVPPAGMHQGQGADALQQYLQVLQARQQAMRSQFLPKTAGLLGG
jgi:hypothetical protein